MESKVSIIIPCKLIDEYTKECIRACLKLEYGNFEIIVLPDSVGKHKILDERIRIIPTEEVTPAKKRNLGMKKSDADFYAFIDSDAYPRPDWLKNAMMHFAKKHVGIVGGPNITPKNVNFAERVSGYVLSNFLISLHAAKRHKIVEVEEFVSELPSCNYIVKKEAASEYDDRFLTAEDTRFCFKARERGFKVLYAGDVVVQHHRRNTIKKHLKQMFVYGRDNLWLFKEEPSVGKWYFFVTMFAILGFMGGIVFSLFSRVFALVFGSIVALYLVAVLVTSIHENLKMTLVVFFVAVVSHFTHGLGSFQGLFVKLHKDFSER